MIESIRLQNLKIHADTAIQLGRLTVLVGPNSSGKTSVLQALDRLGQLIDNPTSAVFYRQWSSEILCKRGSQGFSLSVTGHKEQRLYCTGIESSLEPSSKWSFKTDIKDSPLRYELSRVVYLKINTSNLAAPSYSEAIPPKVDEDGRGLASAIAYLMTYEPERFRELSDALRAVVPFVKRIRVRPARVQVTEEKLVTIHDKYVPIDEDRVVIGHELIFDMAGGDGLPAYAVSTGTLVALCLLTVLVDPERPRLVLLDDLEQGLHPRAQRELMNVLKGFLAADEELQIVATTHSPYIVDELPADAVWVLAADPSGTVACRRLSEHPDALRALEVLTTGEFLSAEGEEWVLAAEPKDV